jgi:hypothetical protein
VVGLAGVRFSRLVISTAAPERVAAEIDGAVASAHR